MLVSRALNNRLAMLVGYLTSIGTALLVPNTIGTVMSQTNIFVARALIFIIYI